VKNRVAVVLNSAESKSNPFLTTVYLVHGIDPLLTSTYNKMSTLVYDSPVRRRIKSVRNISVDIDVSASDSDDELESFASTHVIVRWLFLRGLALVFLLAFADLARQIYALIGSKGILPIGGAIKCAF
jgi:hypothetical protein